MTEKNPLLPHWDELASDGNWSALLLGNGASIAVWQGFDYDSLYDVGKSAVLNPLTSSDIKIFDELGTTNFESVLSALGLARLVNKATGVDSKPAKLHYKNVRNALAEAVNEVHVPWTKAKSRLKFIASELARFKYVFSSNYDLLVYWSVMAVEAAGFVDYFFNGTDFDGADTGVWDRSKTRVCYLHGGLQLYRKLSGGTFKRSSLSGDLLSQFANDPPDRIPLFVSEGTWADKLGAIRRSDYLSFVYEEFSKFEGKMVVFGHSLSEQFDSHLVNAMNAKTVAVGMRPGASKQIKKRQADLEARLPNSEVLFFDATSHPLGASSLRVKP